MSIFKQRKALLSNTKIIKNMDYISITISLIALGVSLFTFWFINVKKGEVKMTRPNIICFLGQNNRDASKVFIRTLLYSTSNQGRYIQNMFIVLRHGETIQNFNVWANDANGLVRGSGLFVNKNGVSSYHHFLLPKDETEYIFKAGNYILQIFIEIAGKKTKMIFEEHLKVTEQQAASLGQGNAIYYDWAPNTRNYFSYTDAKP